MSVQLGQPKPVAAWLLVACLLRLGEPSLVAATHTVEDSAALNAILGEDVLSQNGKRIQFIAALLSERRFDHLARWVLPNETHPMFRLPMEFESVSLTSTGGRKSSSAERANRCDSPAFDLVEAARQSGKLELLVSQIEKCPANNSHARRCRHTMLILSHVANEDFDRAQQLLAKLHTNLLGLKRSEITTRLPETLAIHVAIRHESTRDIAREMLSYLVDSVIRPERSGSMKVWDRKIVAMAGQAGALEGSRRQTVDIDANSKKTNWIPISRRTALSQGLGFPKQHWDVSPGWVKNRSGHDEDYLYFRTPLRGNFQVECDVTSFGWRHSHLMVAGKWVAPVWGLKTYEVGNFRESLGFIDLVPPMARVDDWIRYRTVVKDHTSNTYLNGRLIHSEKLAQDHEPWVAIRSPWYAESEVRDLRITGEPEIPEKLNLSATKLHGWFSYQNAVPLSQSWQASDAQDSTDIVGRQRLELNGTLAESLLQYNRPMVENGSIDFEFFFNEGSIDVHPALGRLAFLIEPDGVRFHRVTDSPWDRTLANPLMSISQVDGPQNPARVPLKSNAWNHLRLKLTGDIVRLDLNGLEILEHVLHHDDSRTFGLFHFADQTQALVRNVTWRGDWPKSLPADDKQQLADPGVFPRLALKDEFRHDFSRRQSHPAQFLSGGFSTSAHELKIATEGLSIHSRIADGFSQCFVAPKIQTNGDFDIIATFDQLRTTVAENGAGGISLEVVFADERATHCSVYRGLVRKTGTKDDHATHLYVHQTKGADARQEWFGNRTEQSQSGRLRLIREGKMLYCLIAEEDSPHFRLVSSVHVPDSDVIPGGIRLRNHGSASEISVTWKSIDIRANKLTGAAMLDTAMQLNELNRHRDQLPQSFTRDFALRAPVQNEFPGLRPSKPWSNRDRGIRVVAKGNDRWEKSGFSVRRAIGGDFDISFRFDLTELPLPASSGLSNALLQIKLGDRNPIRPTLVINKWRDRPTRVYAEVWIPRPQGGFVYQQVAAVEARSVSEFRLVRRGGELFYVVTSEELGGDHIIGKVTVPQIPISSSGVAFRMRAGGDGSTTRVLARQLEIHASKIT